MSLHLQRCIRIKTTVVITVELNQTGSYKCLFIQYIFVKCLLDTRPCSGCWGTVGGIHALSNLSEFSSGVCIWRVRVAGCEEWRQTCLKVWRNEGVSTLQKHDFQLSIRCLFLSKGSPWPPPSYSSCLSLLSSLPPFKMYNSLVFRYSQSCTTITAV